MPSWFSKVFKSTEPETEDRTYRTYLTNPILEDDEEEDHDEPPRQRRVVEAPVLTEQEAFSGSTDGIRIKAAVLDMDSCLFMVNRPVLAGFSTPILTPEEGNLSPLARRLFELDDVVGVQIHHMNVTVHRSPTSSEAWEALGKRVGSVIREHLESGQPGLVPGFLAGIPPEDEIRTRLEQVLETHINPGIAAHSGRIELDRVEGNTAYIRMEGGCQGCAASELTLRQGVEDLFREAVPQLGALLDVTDHAAGANPFYRDLPGE